MRSYKEIFELAQRIEKCVLFADQTILHLKTCSNHDEIFKGHVNINGLYYRVNSLGFEISKQSHSSPIMNIYHYTHTDAYSGYVGDDDLQYIWYKSSTMCDIYDGGENKKLIIDFNNYTEEMFFQDSLIMDTKYQEAYMLMCYFYEHNLPKFKFDIDEIKVIEDVIEYIQTRTEIR